MLISVLMPYWNREALLRQTLESFEQYKDIEVCIAVDGCEPPKLPKTPTVVKTIHLPEKSEPMNPCVPFNWARKLAGGEIICIQNPESNHPTPVLYAMRDALEELGEKGYVLASCWNPGKGRWHCAPGYTPPHTAPIPKDYGLHFCAMLYADFWDEIGGFDEQYRDGAGYDDNDLCWKLHEAGAKVRIIEDKVLHHNTQIKWPNHKVERNKKIFYRKWTPYWNRLSSSECPAQVRA